MGLRVLAAGGGEAAKFLLAPSNSYNPNAATAFTPGAPVEVDVHGILENVVQEDRVTITSAKFMFETSSEIANIQSVDTRLQVRGQKLMCKNVRLRIYMGEIDGYSMDLVK